MTYGAISALRVGRFEAPPDRRSRTRACARCGIVVKEMRAKQTKCADCSLVLKPIGVKTLRRLKAEEARERELEQSCEPR